jgi:hypothetical protein
MVLLILKAASNALVIPVMDSVVMVAILPLTLLVVVVTAAQQSFVIPVHR